MRPEQFLVDRIYEAAIVPEQWRSVLDDLSDLAEGDGTLVFSMNERGHRWIGSGAAEELQRDSISTGWELKNPRAPRLFAARHPGFMTDLDVFTRAEVDREPYFTEFLRPRGFGWGVATALQVPNGDMLAIDVERRFVRGPADDVIKARLDGLRPHLARAALVSSRLAFERVSTATETLELMGLPAGVLGRRGTLLAANPSFESLMPRVLAEGGDRLVIADKAADAVFAEGLPRLSASLLNPTVSSIPVSGEEDRPPLILHLIPIRGLANDLFVNASAILIITPVDRAKVPSAEVLQGLFDLTPAEARAARGVAGGQTLDEIASVHGLSRETVRSQMKSAFAKTGVRRQVDLARLLATVAPPGVEKDAP